MKTLDFITGVHHDGVNVTVRLGLKWACLMGEELVFLSTNGVRNTEKGRTLAKIHSYTAKEFRDITPADIQDEHDPSCRTIEGLRAAMLKAYPFFADDALCVILRYIPMDIS